MTISADAPSFSAQSALSFAGFLLHPDGTLLRDGQQIHLAPRELAALRLLLRHAGKLVTAAQLQRDLWGDVHVTADSVPRCISALRARLGMDSCIQTVYKQGYRLSAHVLQVSQDPDQAAPRLAIMPFTAGPGVPEHLGSAVADEVTAQMTASLPRSYTMLARDSVFTLASRGMTAQQVGEALQAELVLTGTIQAMPAHMRLRGEMVRVDDGTQLWVEDVLVPCDRSAELPKQMIERLAFRAGCPLPSPDAGQDPNQPAADPQAFDLVLRARHEWHSLDRNRMQEGIRQLQRAAEIDPRLEQIPVEIVRATVARELFGFMEPVAAAQQIRKVAENQPAGSQTATLLSPALAWIGFHVDRDLTSALEFVHPGGASPTDPWEMRMRALLAAGRHRFSEASALLERALAGDPFSPWVRAALAWTYHLAGNTDESLRHIRRCLEIAPDHAAPRLYGGMIFAFQGDTKAAVELTTDLTRNAAQFDMAFAVHAYALACHGRRSDAEECLERLQWLSRERYVLRSFSAAAYLAINDEESALAELSAADESRCPWFFPTLADPRLERLHRRPEFRQLTNILERMEGRAVEEAGDEALQPAEIAR